jgi:hypothetical protein
LLDKAFKFSCRARNIWKKYYKPPSSIDATESLYSESKSSSIYSLIFPISKKQRVDSVDEFKE